MEIKSNIEIATLHFVLILKKLGHISALRYAIYIYLYKCILVLQSAGLPLFLYNRSLHPTQPLTLFVLISNKIKISPCKAK